MSRSKKRPIPLKCDMEKKYKNENCHLCLVSLSSLIVVLMNQIFSLNVILMFISKHWLTLISWKISTVWYNPFRLKTLSTGWKQGIISVLITQNTALCLLLLLPLQFSYCSNIHQDYLKKETHRHPHSKHCKVISDLQKKSSDLSQEFVSFISPLFFHLW